MMFAVTGPGLQLRGDSKTTWITCRREIVLVRWRGQDRYQRVRVSGRCSWKSPKTRLATSWESPWGGSTTFCKPRMWYPMRAVSGPARSPFASIPAGEFDRRFPTGTELLISEPGASGADLPSAMLPTFTWVLPRFPSKIMRYDGAKSLVVGVSFTCGRCQRGGYRQGSRDSPGRTGIRPTGRG